MVVWDLESGKVVKTVDLSSYGRVWAVRRAPSGLAVAMVESDA